MASTRPARSFRDLVDEAKTRINEVSQEEFRQWLEQHKDMIVLDVRESNDHVHSRIESSLNIPRGVLELEIEDAVPNRDKTIVAYCGGGSRSALAADTLQQMGYDHVYSLKGGYRGWKEHPIENLDYDAVSRKTI